MYWVPRNLGWGASDGKIFVAGGASETEVVPSGYVKIAIETYHL